MSKKHFELLAEKISAIHDRQARVQAAAAVALACSKINDRFDWVRFMRACDAE